MHDFSNFLKAFPSWRQDGRDRVLALGWMW